MEEKDWNKISKNLLGIKKRGTSSPFVRNEAIFISIQEIDNNQFDSIKDSVAKSLKISKEAVKIERINTKSILIKASKAHTLPDVHDGFLGGTIPLGFPPKFPDFNSIRNEITNLGFGNSGIIGIDPPIGDGLRGGTMPPPPPPPPPPLIMRNYVFSSGTILFSMNQFLGVYIK